MRLVSIVFLLCVAAMIVTLVYPGHELAGAKAWLIGRYTSMFNSGGALQNTVAQIVGVLAFATATLLAVIRTLDT